MPFVGELVADTNLTSGFFIDNLELEASEGSWIKVDNRYCGKNRFLVKVVGDSMEPTIEKYDYVVCEYHRKPYNSKVVIMQPGTATLIDGDCAIKRISEDKENWIFSSDNTKYQPIIISKDFSEGYPIIGEVIYNLSKKLKVQ